MTLSMTINNADSNLLDAIKSVFRDFPKASFSFREVSPLEESLLSDRDEIRAELETGTLQTYSSMAEYRRSHAL